eukprot:1648789-Amphidinium_carterae.1
MARSLETRRRMGRKGRSRVLKLEKQLSLKKMRRSPNQRMKKKSVLPQRRLVRLSWKQILRQT